MTTDPSPPRARAEVLQVPPGSILVLSNVTGPNYGGRPGDDDRQFLHGVVTEVKRAAGHERFAVLVLNGEHGTADVWGPDTDIEQALIEALAAAERATRPDPAHCPADPGGHVATTAPAGEPYVSCLGCGLPVPTGAVPPPPPTQGERIAAARRAAGMTQAQLGAAVGRSESWVGQVERGTHLVDRLSLLRQLADALGLSLDDLATDPTHHRPPGAAVAVCGAVLDATSRWAPERSHVTCPACLARLRVNEPAEAPWVARMHEVAADIDLLGVDLGPRTIDEYAANLAQAAPLIAAADPRCPDRSGCAHDCTTWCWRVAEARPRPGTYPGDEWPRAVLDEHRAAYRAEQRGGVVPAVEGRTEMDPTS